MAVLVRLDRPEVPVLVALSVDRYLIEERVWSPTWVEQIAYHGTDPLPDVAPTPRRGLLRLISPESDASALTLCG